MKIRILGSGMAGFGATYRFREAGIVPDVYDKNAWPFGHTVSHEHLDAGFVFDDGPHVSFTKDERIKKLFAGFVNNEYEEFATYVDNWWHDRWIKHPCICNLHGLPVDIVTGCIGDFVNAQKAEHGPINNYEDWLLASYGETYYRQFPHDYTIKYHTVAAENMSTEWVGPRLYQADIQEVIKGALTPETEDVHYIKGFRYPKSGGFQSYLKPFTDWVDIQLNHKVTAIDPQAKLLTFADGKEIDYDFLVSSIALPDLVPMITGVPQEVLDAAGRLAATSCVLVNIGIDNDAFTRAHWTYIYDMDYSFTRLSFPHNLSKSTCPEGCGAIQAEVYFSRKYKPMEGTADDYIEPVIRDLRRCGLITDDDEILFRDATYAEYANVIFDLEREENLAKVHAYLDEVGIRYCGRYGDWGYMWTDDSFKSGERAAQSVIDEMSG
jgi:protoporphyrinogen oxidase